MADQQDDDVRPRTLKGVRDTDWNEFIRAAQRANLPLGQWIVQAGHAAIRTEREVADGAAQGEILAASSALVPAGRRALADPGTPLAEIAELLRVMRDVTGQPPPDRVADRVYSLLMSRMQRRRQPRGMPGQTGAA